MSESLISEARQRNSRASELQKAELIKYFEDNPEAIRIVNGSTGDQKTKQRIWIEIAHRLNLMGGTLKSTSKWAKYWNDIILYTRSRAKSIIAGSSKNDRAPTSMDKKILSITGHEYLLKKWLNCLDSNSGTPHQENSSNSDVSTYDQEDEVLQVSSSEQQYEPRNENSQPDSKSNVSVSKVERADSAHNASAAIRHNHNEFSSNEDSENYTMPRKKLKLESNSDECNNGNSNEFSELLKQLPVALVTLANSFLTLSQSINNVASALEKRNK